MGDAGAAGQATREQRCTAGQASSRKLAAAHSSDLRGRFTGGHHGTTQVVDA